MNHSEPSVSYREIPNWIRCSHEWSQRSIRKLLPEIAVLAIIFAIIFAIALIHIDILRQFYAQMSIVQIVAVAMVIITSLALMFFPLEFIFETYIAPLYALPWLRREWKRVTGEEYKDAPTSKMWLKQEYTRLRSKSPGDEPYSLDLNDPEVKRLNRTLHVALGLGLLYKRDVVALGTWLYVYCF